MVNDKLIWKHIYEFIKFTDYKFVTTSETLDDIWLFSKKNKTIKRIILSKQTAQSTLFMVQKIMDHHDEIESLVNNAVDHYDLILVNQSVHLNEMPMNINVVSCEEIDALNQTLHTPFRNLINKTKPQSIAWYQNRVINNNIIDVAMIKFTPITYSLIALNILIFIVMGIWHMLHKVDTLVDKGGLTHFNFVHGDYYRVITSMFLHFDFQHLLFNMMSLFILGKLVEFLYLRRHYLLIYIGGGIFANLVSLAFDTDSISVGASGAICALMGALISYIMFSGKFDKKFILQIFIGAIIYLAISSLFANVNNYAHFGGLFGGLIIGILIFLHILNHKYFKWMAIGFGVIIILLLVNIYTEKEHHIYNEYAKQAIAAGDDAKAKNILSQVMEKGYENDETYIYRGILKTKQESLSNGIAEWKKGLKSYPNSDKLNYQMALAMRSIDNYDAASKYIDKAIALNSQQHYLNLQKEIKEFR